MEVTRAYSLQEKYAKRAPNFLLGVLIILNLDAPKGCRHSDIPLRIINEKADIFTDILHYSFTDSIYRSEFPLILKVANIPLSLKRMTKILRKTVDQSAYFGTLLTDLYKALDSFSHQLLIAKLHAYGFAKLPTKQKIQDQN